jgi:hypothetical protein
MPDMSHMYGAPAASGGYAPYYSGNQYNSAPPPLAGGGGGEYDAPGYTKPNGPRHGGPGRAGVNPYQQHQQHQQQYQQHPQHAQQAQQHRAAGRR